MFLKWGPFGAALVLALGSVTLLDAQDTSRAKPAQSQPIAPRLPDEPASGETLSPLHAFLGIDPVTGQFKPRNAPPSVPPKQTAPDGTPLPSEPGSEVSTELPLNESTIDDFRVALTKALDEHDDAALAATLTNLTRGVSGYDQLSLVSSRFERLGYLVLFLYPLGIAISELYGAWSRRGPVPPSARERRYHARQRAKRLVLAACSTATIGLFWWAGENRFWWSEPERLLPVAAVIALLLTVSAGLRMMIARAAKDYPFQVIQDLRMQQFALENEIKELRRRLQGDPIAKAV
jgi:hypothetical protein